MGLDAEGRLRDSAKLTGKTMFLQAFYNNKKDSHDDNPNGPPLSGSCYVPSSAHITSLNPHDNTK